MKRVKMSKTGNNQFKILFIDPKSFFGIIFLLTIVFFSLNIWYQIDSTGLRSLQFVSKSLSRTVYWDTILKSALGEMEGLKSLENLKKLESVKIIIDTEQKNASKEIENLSRLEFNALEDYGPTLSLYYQSLSQNLEKIDNHTKFNITNFPAFTGFQELISNNYATPSANCQNEKDLLSQYSIFLDSLKNFTKNLSDLRLQNTVLDYISLDKKYLLKTIPELNQTNCLELIKSNKTNIFSGNDLTNTRTEFAFYPTKKLYITNNVIDSQQMLYQNASKLIDKLK